MSRGTFAEVLFDCLFEVNATFLVRLNAKHCRARIRAGQGETRVQPYVGPNIDKHAVWTIVGGKKIEFPMLVDAEENSGGNYRVRGI
jgi:hypothetical protein